MDHTKCIGPKNIYILPDQSLSESLDGRLNMIIIHGYLTQKHIDLLGKRRISILDLTNTTNREYTEKAFSKIRGLKVLRLKYFIPYGLREKFFKNCKSLKIVKMGNDCIIYYKKKKKLNRRDLEEIREQKIRKIDFSRSNIREFPPMAFAKNMYIETIIMPESYKIIGEYSFLKCYNLVTITLPKNLLVIEKFAFRDCTSLETLWLPDTLKVIGEHCFCGCIKLLTIKIVKSLKTGKKELKEKQKLYLSGKEQKFSQIVEDKFASKLPNSIYSIGAFCFTGCVSLVELKLPDSVQFIKAAILTGCKKLATIFISKNIEMISSDAFAGCFALKNIFVDKENKYYCTDDAGALYAKDKDTNEKIALVRFPVEVSFETYRVPETVRRLCYESFANSDLKIIEIPSIIRVYDSSVFIFSRIHTLNMYQVGNKISCIDIMFDKVFSDCKFLKTFYLIPGKRNTIPKNVTLRPDTFKNCSKLEEIYFEEDYTQTLICNNVFTNCKKLRNIVIPKSVKTIGSEAFYNCENLQTVEIYDGNLEKWEIIIKESIKQRDFKSNEENEKNNKENDRFIIIRENFDGTVSEIKEVPKTECEEKIKKRKNKNETENNPETNLINDIILDKIPCKDKAKNKINDKNIISIENNKETNSLILNDNEILMDKLIIDEEDSLVSVSETLIESLIIDGPQDGNKQDKENITISDKFEIKPGKILLTPEDIDEQKRRAGIIKLQNKRMDKLFASIKNSDIKNNQKKDNRNTLKGNLIHISEKAFYNCNSLSEINFPDSTESIGKMCFNCCSFYNINLSNIRLIDENAFYDCTMLQEVTLSDTIQEPNDYLKECPQLRTIKVSKNYDGNFDFPENVENIIVNPENKKYCDIDGVVYTKNMRVLKRFPKGKKLDCVYCIPKFVKVIAEKAFFKCTFPRIVRPLSVLSTITREPLYYLEWFKTGSYKVEQPGIGEGLIALPDDLEQIEDYAFAENDNLEEIILSYICTATITEKVIDNCKLNPKIFMYSGSRIYYEIFAKNPLKINIDDSEYYH